jgi:hypothetical protein
MAAVAKVAKTFGRSHSVPKLLASFATGYILIDRSPKQSVADQPGFFC